jgi:VCBS repeat-containing protein
MGIDASRSINRNRSIKAERRNGFRSMLCENLERRELMASNILDLDFRLLSVAPNTGEILSTTRSNSLNESPRELIFRFAGGDDVLQTTLRNGIRITRAGGDGIFGSGGVSTDIIVTPEYLDFADPSNRRVVVARFSQPLPDDLYNVEVFGIGNSSAIRNVANESLKPTRTGTDRDTYSFNLELGTKIVAVVPQPIVRQANGSLTQQRERIEIYFNDSELYDRSINTGDISPDPSVVDLQYYKLMLTNDTVSPNDDRVYSPVSVSYDPVVRRAVLTFSGPIDELPGVGNSGTFRLRVGSNEAVASAATPIAPSRPSVTSDPAGFLSGAFELNSGNPLTGSFSTILSEEVRNTTTLLPNDFPGSNFEPGHREIQDESHIGAPDADPEIAQLRYSFMEGVPYGNDAAGRPVFTSISPDQKQRVREVFEFFSRKLGLDAVEFTGTSVDGDGVLKVVVGDMAPNNGVSGPGDVIGIAGGELAIMDGAEAWDNTFGLGSNLPGTQNFFTTAMHEIGHLLGYGHTYDLPNGTIMGSDGRLSIGTPPSEQVFPGDVDIIHGQHMYRPDNRDVDLYRFVVAPGSTGRLRAETIAERLNDSSNADTYLTLLRRESDGSLTTVAANDNYFSQDSFVDVELQPGEYFLSVTGSGNQDNNPLTADTGSGATSQGRYELRVDFKSTTASSIVEEKGGSTAKGSALDGDGDGIAGGNFDFWIRAASPVGTPSLPAGSPRTIVVDKAFNGVTRDGSLARPFNRITEATAIATPGDIIRIVGDTRTTSLTDDAAYEIGFGGASVGTLSDGASLDVPRGVTLMVDAGAILKFGGSRILVGSIDSTTNRSGSAIQVLGTPSTPVYFTSYFDQSLGIDTNPLITSPRKGDWGGIEIRNDVDRAQGRANILIGGGKILSADPEREGIFLNTISNADMRWGGGTVGTGAQSKVVSPIELAEARPLIIGNKIQNSSDSAMSADPNSFEQTLFTEPRYQSGGEFIPDYDRVGPKIYSNIVTGNSINGLFVRAETLAGQPLKELTVPGRIDDSEITIVFGENVIVQGTPGGAMEEDSAPSTSLLTLTNVAPTSGSGFTSSVAVNYVVTFVDRFGQESLPSASQSVLVSPGSAIRLGNIPAATSDYVSRRIWRQINNTGAYQLAGVLNRDDATYVDNNITLNGTMQTSIGQALVHRARRDASLVIDPGIVAKMLGGRIEVGIGATLLAEGSESKPIVFTSRRDDRYGAAGTFDTNNDGAATTPNLGDWSGIVSRHLGTLSIDTVLLSYGGGESRIPGGFASFNAIEIHQSTARVANSILDSNASGATNLGSTNRDTRGVNEGAVIFVVGSQPVIINNIFKNNRANDTAAISIDANALNSIHVRDTGRSIGENQREEIGIGNFGPLVKNNQLGGNNLNGMRVRGATLTTESVWDDTDMVHLLQSAIIVPDYHTYGGLRLTSKADESLVVKASNGASITAEGRPLDIKDRIGGTLQVIGQPGFPVVITSLTDDSIGAGFDFSGNSLIDTNNDGASVGSAGSWRGITFAPFANDRNVDFRYERESDEISQGTNDFPSDAEDLGSLASNLNAGDENLRLGVTLTGSVASPRDLDVYRFSATAGTMLWIDVDQTSGSLDSVIELIDGNGQIIAQSNNSIAESVAKSIYSDPVAIPPGRVLPMDQSAWAKTNANEPNAQVDFLGVNPLDAGFRVALPGVAGSFNSYFVRVRSSNVSQEPGKNDPARLTNPALVREGITIGGYKVQLRLQQQQEVAGSTVRYADLRFAQVGIDVQGGPMHSPLVGEVGEQDPNETNASDQSAISLGNILTNDRAGVSIAANLASRGDIDWYNFSVAREGIQQVSSTPASHIALTFDIDYADGQGRANTQLWIFRRDATSGQLTLVATANDSNIQDDQPRVGFGSDVTDLTRGSQGKRDAYLGPIELPQGDYTVAVTNASLKNVNMDQFTDTDGTPGTNLVRVEPLDSVQVISEDRFDPDNRPSRNLAPVQESFALGSTSPSMPNAGGVGLPNAVPFNLSDVTLFAGYADQLLYGNALTGAKEGTGARFSRNAADIAVSPAGGAFGAGIPTGGQDSNGSVIFGIDIGDAGVGVSGGSAPSAGLITYYGRIDPGPPINIVIEQRSNVGDGMRFHALSFSDVLSNNGPATFWGVGSRTSQLNTGAEAPWKRNILYRLDPATGNAINLDGSTTTLQPNINNAGTQIAAAGVFGTATGEVTGLATVGGNFFGVSTQGELVTLNSTVAILRDPVTNQPINFTGMSPGPRNVEGERFADLLFGITAAGRIYAFDTTGQLQPIFPRGQSFAQTAGANGLGGAIGIDFSSLDVNMWHASQDQAGQAGVGRPTNFNNSRDVSNNQNSLRFAFDSDASDGDAMPGNWSGIYAGLGMENSYAAPGGAMGALESDLIDLRNYSADDQPMLYFNYLANTQDNNAPSELGDNVTALDTLRVYGTSEDGIWMLLATSNSNTNTNFDDIGPGSDEMDLANSRYTDAYGRTRVAEQLFDNGQWRQARINLGPLAGKRDVKLRFEFSPVGDFRSADPLRGGIELGAVSGDRIADGNTMILAGTTFEFDLGLVLNLPSGQSIQNGDQIKINNDLFTFNNAGSGFNIPFTANDTPATLAAALRTVLENVGYTVATSTTTPGVLNVTHSSNVRLTAPTLASQYDVFGADKAIIVGLPGVQGTNTPIFVTNEMDATEVRDAVRTGLALAWNIPTQQTNIDMYTVRGNVIVIHSTDQNFAGSNAGPLTIFGRRRGDNFGPIDGGDRWAENGRRTSGNRPSTGSVPAGIFLDDFIIGFAERGEVVLSTTGIPGSQTFNDSRFYERAGGPAGAPAREVNTGTYQLEIRVAADYGTTNRQGELRLENTLLGPLGRTYDTNERLTKSAALIFDSASEIEDGASFTLSDGVRTVLFEFDVVTSANDRRVGVTPGSFAIQVNPSDTSELIARAIRDAINTAFSRGLIGLTAENGGDMPGSANASARSIIIQLNGPAAVDAFGGTTFPANVPLQLFQFGLDSQWGEDLGDSNIFRDQGQLVISSAVVSNSLTYGIRVDAAARDYAATRFGGSTTTIRPGSRPYPGAVRNLVTLNTSNVAPGVVLMNNVLAFNGIGANPTGSGGILISGDVVSPAGQPTSTVARVVNNTIHGVAGNSVGLTINDGAAPTVINNIFSNSDIGVSIAGASTGNVVLGGNLYKQNRLPVVPANTPESFAISLLPSQPLFLNPTLGRFYLAALSQAIDSSLSSLENRSSIETVKAAIGLPTSPVLAPEFDANGLRRSDDPDVNSPPGLGSNVFIDRGALDRVDQIGPAAFLQRPLDNDANGIDADGSNTYVQVRSGNFDFFEILLDERQGTGPDPLSINQNNVILTENGRVLSPGVDYVFGYSFNSRTIRLTPLAGFWRQDSVYELTLINKPTLRIIGPSDAATRTDGDTFTITLAGGGTRTLELDSGYILSVAAGGVVDGDSFTYKPAGGEAVRFEFNLAGNAATTYGSQIITFSLSDTPATLSTKIAAALSPFVKQNGWPVQAIGSGRIAVGGNVGDLLTVAGSSLSVIGAPGVAAGRTAVRFLPIASFDAVAMANQISKALNQVGSGIKAYTLASGVVYVEGVSAITGVQSLTISPIVDLAGNLLQANRANSLTQFTILMPETAVDYGDAVERPGTGSNSSTLLADNGVRHGLYPDDSSLLVLGAFADGDTDGKPSNAADGDDFGSSLDPNTLSSFISINANGPARLETKPVSINSFGKTLTITDAIGNVVTYQYVDSTHPLTNATYLPVDLTGLASATDTATALKNAILNSILNGQITGIHAVSTGNVVSLGGTSAHRFDVSGAGSEITRSLKGTLGLTVASNLTGLTAGQSLIITDGVGNTVGYQIVNTNPTAPAFSLSVGNYAIGVDLSTATASDVATALANAINTSIRDLRLKIPAVSAVGAVLVIQNDDEDGFSYNNWFNKKALPTPITLTASGSGFVDAWIDWNQDNDFSDPGEQILLSEPVVAGTNTFYVTTPASAAIGFTTARFRLSTTGGLFNYGLGIGGEVEDHLIEVLSGDPPVGANDRFQTAEDNFLTVNAPGVLANDVDPDLDPIRVFDSDRSQPGVQPVLGPQNGYLTLNADGSFVYVPKQDFFGTDTFIYYVTDRRMTSNLPVTVTVTVTPVNDAPVAVDDTVSILEDAPTTWNGSVFTANDRTQPDRPAGTDGDLYDTNEALQILRVIDAQLVKDRGLGEQLTLVNNVLTYNPPKDYNNRIDGPILVRILIQDSGVAGGDELPKSPGADDMPPTLTYSTLTINIQDVNDRPQFTIPTPVNVPLEDASVTEPNFLTLIDPSPLTALDELGPTTATPSLQRQSIQFLVRALDPTRFTPMGQPAISPTGTLTYQLNNDVNFLNSGPILVEVIAQDNGNAPGSRPGIPDLNQSLPQTFTITPTEVNDAPQFVLPNPIISINEDLEVSPRASFATNIQAGPSTAVDELGLISGVPGQNVRFQVDALDPTRFNGAAGQPRISPNGTLTYDLNPDVNILNSGDIVVRVYALDDGPVAGSRPGIPDVNRSADQFFTIRATEVNDAPQFTIANPIVTIREDLENSPITAFVTNIQAGPSTAIDELGLVSGVPGQTVSFVVTAADPTKFSVQPAISPTGVLTYDLAPDVNLLNSGDILINVYAIDNGPAAGSRPGIPDVNQSASVQLTIRVTEVNDAPQFSIANPVVAINEDLEVSPLVGFVNNILAGPLTARDELGLVPGVPGQTVSFVVTAVDPTRFLVQPSINASGDLRYDLNPDVNVLNSGDILVRVKAVDNGPAAGSRPGIPDVNVSAEQTFTIRVTEVNDAPLFTIPNPVISIFEDLEVSPIAGFVTNIQAGPSTAIDELGLVNGVPGQSVTFTVTAIDPTRFTTQPAIAPNGTLTYDLAPDVNILNSGDILVRVVAIDNGPAAPSRPGIPDVNRSTVQTFTIRVTEVNDPPIFTMAATTLNLREDAGFQTVPNFITNLGPGPLTATDEVNQTTTIIAQAIDMLAFSIQPLVTGTGDLTYQVAPDVNRLFTNRDLRIRLIATDNGNPNETTIKTLTLNVAEINDAPQYTIPSSVVTVFEDNESVTGFNPTSIPGFATNVRPGPTTALDEVNQKLTFNIFFSSNPNLFSVQPSIDATGKLTFVTAPDQNGTAVFFVRLEDDGAASPFPNTNVGPNATFTIIIKPVNDAPQFTIPATTTSDEDQGVVTLAGFASAIRPGPITAADESIQELTFDVVAVDPSAFLVQPSLLVDGTLTYQMAKDINRNSGKDTRVVVTLRDNGLSGPPPNTNVSASKTFTINVNPTNDPPIPVGYLTSTSEDTRVTIQSADVIAKDLPGPADEIAEGQKILMTNIESTTAQGGTILPVFSNGQIVRFDYIPPLNYVGQDLVRYVITDDATYKPGPQSATGTLTINVGPINDPPVFTAGGNVAVLEDSAPYAGLWATDIAAGPPGALDEISGPNAQTVGFEITTNNDALFAKLPAVSSTGQLSFTLAKDANGTVVVVVTAVDSGLSTPPPNNNRSKPATFTITVAPVNDAPDFTVTRSINVDEDSGAFTGIILSNIVPAIGNNSVPPTALDESNQSVTISTSTDRPNLFSAQPTIDANGVLRFTPALNANGSAIVFVVATDNGPGTFPNVNVSATKSFTIAIRPVNDAPIANNDRYSTSETTVLNVVAPGVLANDTDVDLPDDALSVASFQSTSDLGAKVTVKSDGSLSYDPTGSARIRALVDGQTATDTFTYRIQDRAGLLSNLATVTVTVSGFNDPPVAVNDSFSVPFGASQLLNVLANDFDVDTPLDLGSIEIGRLAIHGTATATPTGRVLYTPVAGFRGSDSFTYRVRDSLGKFSNEATVSITVNTAPVAVPDSFVVKQGTQTSLRLTGNDYDPDGTINPTSVVVVTPSPVASATVQPDGQVLFIPQAGYTGTTKFQYVVSDNDGLSSNVADVTVRVVASLYQNPNNQYDVNADTFVSPIDVLVLVNLLNSQGPSIPVEGLPGPPDYVDVNGDGNVDPRDVLQLINFINAGGNSGSGGEGEGEGSLVVGVQAAPPPELVRAAEARNSAVQQAGILKDLLDESVPYGPQMLTDSTGETDPMDSYLGLLSSDESTHRKKGSLDDIFSDDDWLS